MDKFKENLVHFKDGDPYACDCNCKCSNHYLDNKDRELERMARSRFKRETQNEIENGITEWDLRTEYEEENGLK